MMEAVEFKAKIRDGIIQVPKNLRDKFKTTVKVILISDNQKVQPDILDSLLKNPVKIKDFTPLSRDEIHDRI